MKKILIATNALTHIAAEVVSGMIAEIASITKKTDRYQIIHWTASRMSIDRMRNEAAKMAMNGEFDYLVFIDDDMLMTPGTLEALVESDYDVIMAHTLIRSYPFPPMSFVNTSEKPGEVSLKQFDDVIEKANPKGISDCHAVGFACVALKVSTLVKVSLPLFATGPAHTEDVYYCVKAKKEIGPEVKIGVHTKFPTYHAVETLYVGEKNKKQVVAFFESFKEDKSEGRGDRTEDYHKKMEQIS